MAQHLRRLQQAQDTVEYALLITLIALAAAAAVATFGQAVAAEYGDASECVPIHGKGPPEGVPGRGPPACKGGRRAR